MKKITFAILSTAIVFAACTKQDSTNTLLPEDTNSSGITTGRHCLIWLTNPKEFNRL